MHECGTLGGDSRRDGPLRCKWVDEVCFWPIPPVQVTRKRSVGQCQQSRGSPMTAVPRTAAIRANTGRTTQQPLRGSQREYASHHPPAAAAAKRPYPSSPSCCHRGNPHPMPSTFPQENGFLNVSVGLSPNMRGIDAIRIKNIRS